MTGTPHGVLSTLRRCSPSSPRPQALARSPLSDKNPDPQPVGREALQQTGEVGMVRDCATILAPSWPLLGPGELP